MYLVHGDADHSSGPLGPQVCKPQLPFDSSLKSSETFFSTNFPRIYFLSIFSFRPFLLECTNWEVRRAFCEILSCAVQNYVNSGAPTVSQLHLV